MHCLGISSIAIRRHQPRSYEIMQSFHLKIGSPNGHLGILLSTGSNSIHPHQLCTVQEHQGDLKDIQKRILPMEPT